MGTDYILALDGHNVFREVELKDADTRVRIGTGKHCEERFRKDLFFAPFDIELKREEGGAWAATCSDAVYFSANGVGRFAYRRLVHGDEFAVRYSDSGATLFTVRFSIDFEQGASDYERSVSLLNCNQLSIGGTQTCNLRLRSAYIEDDLILIQRTDAGFVLIENSSQYGVFCDGRRISGSMPLNDMTFFSIADFSFYFKNSTLFFSREADIIFNGVAYTEETRRNEGGVYPLFNRNTRIKAVVDNSKIPVLTPPSKPQKPKSNIVVQLLPAVGMLAVIVFLRGSMAGSAGSGFILISAASMGVGILASVLGIVSERKNFKKELAEREEQYQSYIEEKRTSVGKLRAEERAALDKLYLAPSAEIGLVERFSSDLFDRRSGDDDFLHVMLGLGRRVSARQLDYKRSESLSTDELAKLPEELCSDYEYLEEAPITVDLAHCNAIGVYGPHANRIALMRNIVVDIAVRQYEADVKMFAFVEPKNSHAIMWARLLPHLRNEDLNCWNIVCDDESRNIIFEYLYKVLTAREGAKGVVLPHIVVLVLDDCGLRNHPISQFVDSAKDLGVTFVFFDYAKERLPLGCDWIVSLDDANGGSVVSAADSSDVSKFAFEPISEVQASAMANALAPVYCEEVSLEGTLTKSISLFELLGIISADDIDLESRWATSEVERSMAAPLGVSKSRTVYLDLHDKADGPHGLVAGTTGSGKSEILQTYILSVATLFHPYEVSFLIIDFKGGGMVNQFRDLPHLVGAITNIDGREIDRSLKSIKAELQKRQRLFAEADVNHISAYIRKFKAGEVPIALPHLIIIVDEFAELKAEQPDFMKELISASRIGRSLGVHLILATQKPSGQVNEQIWSNSRFKLCLKVQSKEDSNEVIKSPLAAEIKEPGRAYLQVGNNEVFELFQSGFSGAPERENDDNTKEYVLYHVNGYGKRTSIYERKKRKSLDGSSTQLDAIVSHVARYCVSHGIEQLPSICLPPLESAIDFPARSIWKKNTVALGIYDDPDNQYQGEAFFDLDGSNTLVIGSSQTGKTNLLQTMVRAIAQEKSPRQAALYIMDFASMVLRGFEGLGHVGGVVLPGEDEKVKNLFKLLGSELAARKRRLLDVGVSSFAAYEEAGFTDFAHIYVLIDNFAVFKELYSEGYEDELVSLCRDGLAYGISFVITNSTTTGIGYKYFSNFSGRIALTCNDSTEYSTLIDRCRMQPKNVPGRALCSFDKEAYEFQVYLAFAGEREIDRSAAIASFVQTCNSRYEGQRVRAIPSVPDDLDLRYLSDNYQHSANEMQFALSYATVEPVTINLDSQFSLSIVGKDAGDRVSVVRALLAELHESVFDRPVEVHIIDGIMRELQSYESFPYVLSYSSDASQVSIVFEDVRTRLQERYSIVSSEGLMGIAAEPYIVVVVNSADAISYISETSDVMNAYTEMAKQYASMRVLFVFSDLVDASVSFSSPALLKALKEERRAFVVTNMSEHKFFDVSSAVSRSYKTPLEDGQAFYFDGVDVAKVRLARQAEG